MCEICALCLVWRFNDANGIESFLLDIVYSIFAGHTFPINVYYRLLYFSFARPRFARLFAQHKKLYLYFQLYIISTRCCLQLLPSCLRPPCGEAFKFCLAKFFFGKGSRNFSGRRRALCLLSGAPFFLISAGAIVALLCIVVALVGRQQINKIMINSCR